MGTPLFSRPNLVMSNGEAHGLGILMDTLILRNTHLRGGDKSIIKYAEMAAIGFAESDMHSVHRCFVG